MEAKAATFGKADSVYCEWRSIGWEGGERAAPARVCADDDSPLFHSALLPLPLCLLPDMFPDNGGMNAADQAKAVAAGLPIHRIATDVHVGSAGAIQQIGQVFAKSPTFPASAINGEVNAMCVRCATVGFAGAGPRFNPRRVGRGASWAWVGGGARPAALPVWCRRATRPVAALRASLPSHPTATATATTRRPHWAARSPRRRTSTTGSTRRPRCSTARSRARRRFAPSATATTTDRSGTRCGGRICVHCAHSHTCVTARVCH